MGRTQITEIKGLASLQNLEFLFLDGNEIREIDLKVVESFPKLKELRLSGNSLSYNYKFAFGFLSLNFVI